MYHELSTNSDDDDESSAETATAAAPVVRDSDNKQTNKN